MIRCDKSVDKNRPDWDGAPMRHFSLGWLLLMLGALLPASSARAEFRFEAIYGASSDFWQSVELLQKESVDPDTLYGMVDSTYNNPGEGVARFQIRHRGRVEDALSDVFTHG